MVTQSYSTLDGILAPLYQGQIGHPVLFNSRWDFGPLNLGDKLVTNPMGFWSPLYQGQIGHPVLFNSRWDSGPHYIRNRWATASFSTLGGDFGPLNLRDKLATQSYSTLDGTLIPQYIRDRLATRSYSAMRFWSPPSQGQIGHPVLFNYEIPVYPGTIIQPCMHSLSRDHLQFRHACIVFVRGLSSIQPCMHSVCPGTIFTSAMHA